MLMIIIIIVIIIEQLTFESLLNPKYCVLMLYVHLFH